MSALLFRDAKDFSHESGQAYTVYGARAQIPKGLDLFVAGTSCKAFSTLNNYADIKLDHGKTESSQTFMGVSTPLRSSLSCS